MNNGDHPAQSDLEERRQALKDRYALGDVRLVRHRAERQAHYRRTFAGADYGTLYLMRQSLEDRHRRLLDRISDQTNQEIEFVVSLFEPPDGYQDDADPPWNSEKERLEEIEYLKTWYALADLGIGSPRAPIPQLYARLSPGAKKQVLAKRRDIARIENESDELQQEIEVLDELMDRYRASGGLEVVKSHRSSSATDLEHALRIAEAYQEDGYMVRHEEQWMTKTQLYKWAATVITRSPATAKAALKTAGIDVAPGDRGVPGAGLEETLSNLLTYKG